MKIPALVIGGLLVASAPVLHAGCCLHYQPAEIFQKAEAVVECRILTKTVIADEKGVSTRYTAELNRTFKGDPPDNLAFSTPGGSTAGRMEISSDYLDLETGADYVLHLQRLAGGGWKPLPVPATSMVGTQAEKTAIRTYFGNGAEGVFPKPAPSGIGPRDVTSTGYAHHDGVPARITACDGGMAIPYLVDLDPAKLPAGMDTAEALAAVEECLGVWAAESSLTFRYEGLQSFGMAAGAVPSRDGRLRIQLHDSYGFVGEPNAGIGGTEAVTHPTVFRGGKVGEQGFQEIVRMFLVLKDTEIDNETLFKSVLTHEIGHALGLAHSSEDAGEGDAQLSGATMYYKITGDGNGASLAAWDIDRIHFGYPQGNTPPYITDHFIHAISDSGSGDLPQEAGVNRINLHGIDLQGDTSTPVLSYGGDLNKFTLSGSQLVYAPTGFTPDQPRKTDEQIAAGDSYGFALVQLDDGTNLSRAAYCPVVQISRDTRPVDGLPNNWMTTYFGTIEAGAENTASNPSSDPDGDGLSNREEFILGTDPLLASSPPPAVSYDHAARSLLLVPLQYAPYRIQASSDLVNWETRAVYSTSSAPFPVLFDTSGDSSAGAMFYRALPTP